MHDSTTSPVVHAVPGAVVKRPGDVLVVDDDRDIREVVVGVLEQAGYACRSAANGRDALVQIAAARPALVLLDMQMPVMNGWDCAREIRAIYGRALPIIASTAVRQPTARREPVEIDAVLGKPYPLEDLLARVAAYVAPRAR
jgi:CheY-like chemotaxis protein